MKKTRYAVSYALLADVTGSVAGIAAAYISFIKELQGVRGGRGGEWGSENRIFAWGCPVRAEFLILAGLK